MPGLEHPVIRATGLIIADCLMGSYWVFAQNHQDVFIVNIIDLTLVMILMALLFIPELIFLWKKG